MVGVDVLGQCITRFVDSNVELCRCLEADNEKKRDSEREREERERGGGGEKGKGKRLQGSKVELLAHGARLRLTDLPVRRVEIALDVAHGTDIRHNRSASVRAQRVRARLMLAQHARCPTRVDTWGVLYCAALCCRVSVATSRLLARRRDVTLLPIRNTGMGSPFTRNTFWSKSSFPARRSTSGHKITYNTHTYTKIYIHTHTPRMHDIQQHAHTHSSNSTVLQHTATCGGHPHGRTKHTDRHITPHPSTRRHTQAQVHAAQHVHSASTTDVSTVHFCTAWNVFLSPMSKITNAATASR